MCRNRTAHFVFVLGLSVAAGVVIAAAESQPAPVAAGPKIQVDSATHDFGTFWAAGPLTHAFKVTNAGSAVLKITAVSPGCGCTTVGGYPNELKPGESGQLSFSLNTTMLHDRFDKPITVTSNDPTSPTLVLHLTGQCRRQVEITPQVLFFGRLTEQTPQTRSVDITSGTDNPLKVQLDTPTDGPFRFELTEVTPGKKYQLKATLNPPFPQGRLYATARLTTNVESQKTLTVNAIGTNPERIEVQPISAIFPARPVTPPAAASGAATTTQPAADRTAQVMLLNNGTTPVQLKEALADDPKITVTTAESQSPKGYRITIRVPAEYQLPAAPSERSVLLRLDDPEKPFIIVPLHSYGAAQQPMTPAGPTAPQLVGTVAPEFSLVSVGGRTISKAGQAGKITVLDFFSPTCPFCKKQMPRLDVLRKTYEPQGVQFLYVAESVGTKVWTPDEVGQILKGNSVEGDFAFDPGNALGRKMGATGYPTLVVIGKDGKIAGVTTGNKADLEQRVKTQLDPLLGKPGAATQPAAAQTSAR